MQLGDFLKKQQLQKIGQMRNKKTKINNSTSKSSSNQSKLCKRRKKLNISIPELSTLTGINQATLTRWETNGISPNDNISQINKYAKILHLNLQKLVQNI